MRVHSVDYSDSRLLARNTAWMLIGRGVRLLIQSAYFVMMARNLGPRQYGVFVAVAAAAAMVYPFVGNGSGMLMIRNVARDRSVFAEYFGNALLLTTLSGLLLSFGTFAACVTLLPHSIPPLAVLLIVLSDVLVYRFVEVAGWAFQSVEKLKGTAGLSVFVTLTRLIGIVSIVLLHRPTLIAWSIAYLLGSVGSSALAIFWAVKALGRPKFSLARIIGELRDGFYFSTGLSAQTVYNDIDKTMLARTANLEATGIYAAAYRLVDVAFIPVNSLLAAALPGFFRAGAEGVSGTFGYAKRLLPRATAYSLAVGVLCILAAPVVPLVLGLEYARTTEALRWLAILPFLKSCHYFAADSLTGAGHQGLRTLMQILVAVFNILLNLWIIPAYSWRGAAWSSLMSDALLAISLYTTIFVLGAKRTRSPVADEAFS